MKKTILFGSAPGHGRSAIAALLPSLDGFLAMRPWIEACVIHVGSDEVPGVDPVNPDGTNVMLEVWGEEGNDLLPTEAPFPCTATYEVTEILEKGSMEWPVGPVPGFILISRNWPKDGASAEEIRTGYDNHPPLARRVHVGMDAYTRNWIDERNPQDAAAYSSVSILHFPDLDALVNKLYLNDEDRQAIALDAGGFMDRGKSSSLRAVCHKVR